MSLIDIIESGADVSLTIKASDLNKFAQAIISQTRTTLMDRTVEKLMTIDTVAEILQVDRSTLYRWAHQGYLSPIEVGGKKRYRLSDVNRIIEQNNKVKTE